MASLFNALSHLIRKSFKRIPTEAEWADFRKHARRMRNLDIPDGSSFVTPDTLLALQLRTVDEPFLPGLETFTCGELAEAFIPFIPLFLSPKTTGIKISFAEGSPAVAVACTISRLPKMCPKVEFIDLQGLGRDSVITDAASEMLLACNRDCLQSFYVDTPLTEEARKALCQLPKLSVLWAVVQGRTILPPVALPSLVAIYLEFEDCLNWLQGFRGATLENLEFVCFRSESRQIGDLLREFENVARKASAQNTLTTFKFKTSRSWNPNYSALLSFKQLTDLDIEFSCRGGCSSMADDSIISTLAQAMPKLETLKLGGGPCATVTGATVNGLIDLASRCPDLFELRIHFQAGTLVDAATSAVTTPSPDDDPDVQLEGCALTELEVGRIPIPAGSASTVALTLLGIFPRMLDVKYVNPEWRKVAEAVKKFRNVRALVHRRGKACRQTQLRACPY